MIGFPFEPQEYANRLSVTRAEMARRGIELLFIADPANMAWLTGYDGWSFYVHQGVLLPVDSGPVWWGRGQDAAGARLTTALPDGDIRGYADGFVQATDRHPMQDLGALIRDRGWRARRIGVEMENYYYSAKAHAVLTAELPDAEIIDATALVNWRRLVKSPAELTLMRRAARIVEAMHAEIRARLRPGMRKNELVADILRVSALGADGHGGDYPAIAPLLPTGAEAAAPHLTWDDRPLESGAGTFFEIAGCHHRYHCPLCRTACLGAMPADMRRAEAALIEGLADGIAVARPGAATGDVARALAAALSRHGLTRSARCGYPVGLAYPPDWGERTASLREEDETELRPGMTFHFMPGLWMDGWGVEITETIVIRKDAQAERLANVPQEIFSPG